MWVEPHPPKEAVIGEDYSLAKQLVEDGHDPFKSGGMIESSTAFHEAVKKGNLDLLLNIWLLLLEPHGRIGSL